MLPTKVIDEQSVRLTLLKAAQLELTEGADAALKLIGAPTDPLRMQATLGTLLRARRFREAADIVNDVPLNEKWIDKATLAYAYVGNFERATNLVTRADDFSNELVRSDDLPDDAVRFRTRLGFAEGVHAALSDSINGNSILSNRTWDQHQREAAQLALEILRPLLSLASVYQKMRTEFEVEAVEHAILFAFVLADSQLMDQYVARLLKHRPVSLMIAELCLRGLMKCPQNLATRLQLEHPGDFQAKLLAAIVEKELNNRPRHGFEMLLELTKQSQDERQKEQLCHALLEAAGGSDQKGLDLAIEAVRRIWPENLRIPTFLEVMKCLASNQLEAASRLLETVKDHNDSGWWQAYAQLCEKSGNDNEAALAWEKAAELLPHPGLLRLTAQAALSRKHFLIAIRSLAKLLEVTPDDDKTLHNLVFAYLSIGDHLRVTEILPRLISLREDKPYYKIQLADSLRKTNRVPDAIEVLKPIVASPSPPLEAVFLISQLYEANNQHKESYDTLRVVAKEHWDNPRFLLAYMSRAFSAGEDQDGNETLAKLIQLRRHGKVPAELMFEGNIETIISHGRAYHSKQEELYNAILAGRVPWMLAESVLNKPPILAWLQRSRQLKWHSEERQSRASSTIYATNRVTVDKSGSNSLVPISAPKEKKSIVVDITALITLYQLGLLERVTIYYGMILLPASYGTIQESDSKRIGLHQPSREQSLLTIRSAIDLGKIKIADGVIENMAQISEYSEPSEKVDYVLMDVVQSLKQTQKITQESVQALENVAHKPTKQDGDIKPLSIGSAIHIELETLRTLSKLQCFDAILNNFDVFLSQKEASALAVELTSYQAATEAAKTHSAMWDELRRLTEKGFVGYEVVEHAIPENQETDQQLQNLLYLDSVALAQQKQLSLLADDRVLQVAILNQPGANSSSAFGTDILIGKLLSSGDISRKAAGEAFRTLMRWRYRFLIVPSQILLELFDQNTGSPPGDALLDVAVYLHDSLRDPGLHCGPEQSDPPIPIAVKLVTGWINEIVEFLHLIWKDPRHSIEAATNITIWVGEDLMPSCPSGLGYQQVGRNLSELVGRSPLSLAFIQFVSLEPPRANAALTTLATSLCVTNEEYVQELDRTVREIMAETSSKDQPGSSYKQFTLRMLQNAFYHYIGKGLDALDFYRFQDTGFFDSVEPTVLPASLLGILNGPIESKIPLGPLVFLKEQDSYGVVELATVFLDPDPILRSAAADFALRSQTPFYPWLTPASLEIIQLCKEKLQSDELSTWRQAGMLICDSIRNDPFASLAGLKQCISTRLRDGFGQYMSETLHPKLEVLAKIPPEIWDLSATPQRLPDAILELASRNTFEEVLKEYIDRFGFVPLRRDLGPAVVIQAWLNSNPSHKLTWDALFNWAKTDGSPLARFHAVCIAINITVLRPSQEILWEEILNILDHNKLESEDDQNTTWRLLCELTLHYLSHIESLFPAQYGDKVTTLAWWLSLHVGKALAPDKNWAGHSLTKYVEPALNISQFQWTIARSPMVSSELRYMTLYIKTIWSTAILANLSWNTKSFDFSMLPMVVKERMPVILRSLLIVTPLGYIFDERGSLFAFQDNKDVQSLWDAFMVKQDDPKVALTSMPGNRLGSLTPSEFEVQLAKLPELSENDQAELLVCLRWLLFISNKYDNAVTNWLAQSESVIRVLSILPEYLLRILLEALAEYQMHSNGEWPLVLPHILAYVIEQSDEQIRVNILLPYVFGLSISTGSVSAIDRLSVSKWRQHVLMALKQWRDNMQDVMWYSAPWLGCRVRATSATISRIIGPRERPAVTKPEVING